MQISSKPDRRDTLCILTGFSLAHAGMQNILKSKVIQQVAQDVFGKKTSQITPKYMTLSDSDEQKIRAIVNSIQSPNSAPAKSQEPVTPIAKEKTNPMTKLVQACTNYFRSETKPATRNLTPSETVPPVPKESGAGGADMTIVSPKFADPDPNGGEEGQGPSSKTDTNPFFEQEGSERNPQTARGPAGPGPQQPKREDSPQEELGFKKGLPPIAISNGDPYLPGNGCESARSTRAVVLTDPQDLEPASPRRVTNRTGEDHKKSQAQTSKKEDDCSSISSGWSFVSLNQRGPIPGSIPPANNGIEANPPNPEKQQSQDPKREDDHGSDGSSWDNVSLNQRGPIPGSIPPANNGIGANPPNPEKQQSQNPKREDDHGSDGSSWDNASSNQEGPIPVKPPVMNSEQTQRSLAQNPQAIALHTLEYESPIPPENREDGNPLEPSNNNQFRRLDTTLSASTVNDPYRQNGGEKQSARRHMQPPPQTPSESLVLGEGRKDHPISARSPLMDSKVLCYLDYQIHREEQEALNNETEEPGSLTFPKERNISELPQQAPINVHFHIPPESPVDYLRAWQGFAQLTIGVLALYSGLQNLIQKGRVRKS